MKVHRENLIAALELAIKEQGRIEKEAYRFTTDSAFLAGIKDLEVALLEGDMVEFL